MNDFFVFLCFCGKMKGFVLPLFNLLSTIFTQLIPEFTILALYMVTLTTHGVKITVQNNYEDLHSRPTNRYFIFSYRITIENNTSSPIQLLRRHWYIFDSMSGWSEVEGEGVVSRKPLLYPSEEYQYESFCPLVSEAGKIYGTYLMENKSDGTTFFVNIPLFNMIVPCKNN